MKKVVVIPAKIRSRMGLKPKTKFLVYECEDAVILKKLEAMYKRVNERIAKYGELSNDEINEIIQEHRQKKRRSKSQTKNESSP